MPLANVRAGSPYPTSGQAKETDIVCTRLEGQNCLVQTWPKAGGAGMLPIHLQGWPAQTGLLYGSCLHRNVPQVWFFTRPSQGEAA